MEIHHDAQTMSVDELRTKYSKVDQQARELIRSETKRLADNASNSESSLRVGKAFGPPIGYAKILHVGDDYVLLESESGSRTAYSFTQIGRLLWDDGKPNLYVVRD